MVGFGVHQTRSRGMSRSIARVGGKGKERNRVGRRIRRGGNQPHGCGDEAAAGVQRQLLELDSRVEMIRSLIPAGLQLVNELLQEEVTALAGERYSRQGGLHGHDRWGSQRGSVYLSDQKVRVSVPRVRNVIQGQEGTLSTYGKLQEPCRAEG